MKAALWRFDGSRRQSKKESRNVVSGFRFRNPLLGQPGRNPFNECEVRRNGCSCRADRIEILLSFDSGKTLPSSANRSSAAGSAGHIAVGLNRLAVDGSESISALACCNTIENGVRLSGMPAFSGTHSVPQTWRLVLFIRHLPQITAEELNEMKRLDPKSEADPAHF